jgi:HEAT repeat protein
VTNEQTEAAHYLALTDNQKWYPLLRDAAEKNVRISSYPAYAAELGGRKALPMLVALAKSPDREFTGGNAIMAMGSTGSRDAIPVLLDYLNSPDVNISDRASYALQLLTHRTAVRDEFNRDRRSESDKWSQWWKREGATARIYKDTECGETIPLP